MTRRRVVMLIDQASRDAFVLLLVAEYLRWRGVHVVVANQGTLIPLCEWHRPHVVVSAWHMGGPLMAYLSGRHRQTHVVLIDHEGGKLGERNFKRSFEREGGGKQEVGRRCARVLAAGAAQAAWLAELGIVEAGRIVTTGSPRLDPYMVPHAPAANRHLGVTLRGDILTARPYKLMENIFRRVLPEARGGLSVGYPSWAQHEDRLWHVAASTRYMFKIAQEVSRRTSAPIVMRPGPWERHGVYDFLPARIPTATVAPDQSQPAYVRNAFAVVDESTSLSLEAYVAGIPTITTQALIPRLKELTGSDDEADGTLFNAPYTKAYWRPATVEDAVDLILQAEQGLLAPGPSNGALVAYLRDCHGWPRARPSSFQMADAVLELLDVPVGGGATGAPDTDGVPLHPAKRALYRLVPGAARVPGALLYARTLVGRDRELFRRYHYFRALYPHMAEVSRTFEALLRLTGDA